MKGFSFFIGLFLSTLFIAVQASADAGEFDSLIKKVPSAADVVNKPTLFRSVELDGLPVTKRQFEFLLDHPRLSTVLARMSDPQLDAYKVEVHPDGSSHVNDLRGLAGDMELVSESDGRRIYYIKGHWDFPLGIRFNGRMVLVACYGEVGGRVDSRTLGYMRVDNALVGLVAKLVAYIFPGKVDARIARFSGAVRKVAVAVHDDPEGVYKRLAASGEVPAGDLDAYRSSFCARRG